MPIGVNVNGTPRRFFSVSASAREDLQTQSTPSPPPPPPATESTAAKEIPEYMQKWGELDPNTVTEKREERRLVRRDGVQPVGSRRRRTILNRMAANRAQDIAFEQLPFQAFQEARKFLLQDRQEKLKEIETQTTRIKNLMEQDPAVSGGPSAKEARLRSMRNRVQELIILADINDPIVKKKFEDGEGDMNKPIYRYLANEKWRKYKRLILEQRISQMNLVPDLLPAINPVADVDLGFGRKDIAPGEFVDSALSEQMPRLTVQTFEPGEKLVSVVVVDADVPVLAEDSFTTHCHFIASNIPISPTQTSIPLIRIGQEDNKTEDAAARKIALPWEAPYAMRGGPYHRLAVLVFEQKDAKTLDVEALKNIKRRGFNTRAFVEKHKLNAIGASLFRTQWDDSMPGVMERAGLKDLINVQLKRRKIEPLPYKKRTERMR
ncbi:PEBP-like protein [Periconia macrospinosa]|uniref:Large ribosomal subunit protein mL38 n=1 Tax=Periconia macrospinosa TaxID=97972 RepID=A0A2V1E4Y8_9PLEO|nr:PEBP-like protein [Periconia macrospinosa]